MISDRFFSLLLVFSSLIIHLLALSNNNNHVLRSANKDSFLFNSLSPNAAFISSHPSITSQSNFNDFIKSSTIRNNNINREFVPKSSFNRYDSKLYSARQPKDVILSDSCRNYLLEGIEYVANVVKVTLGPRGRNVLLEREYGPPMIVNDGVTIARNIEIKDRRKNAGAKLVQEVASSSDDRAGDGTTSTTILAADIARKGVEYVNKGHNPIPIYKGIKLAAKIIVDEIKKLSTPIKSYDDLMNIATVATSGNKVMGELIAKSFHELGPNAAIVLDEQPSINDTLDFTEGYTFERGWESPHFMIGEEKNVIEWKNPKILLCDHEISNVQSILRLLEHFVKTKEPLVIIADGFSADTIRTLIVNKIKGLLRVAAVKAPSFGERRKDYLRDIAIATNATLVSKDVGIDLENVTVDMLGDASDIVIKDDRTSIITNPTFKHFIEERTRRLHAEIAKSTSKLDREKLSERVAALSGGIARITIGAVTETEQREKRLRYEDAISAVRAAMETGYVPGGGVTYLAMASTDFKRKLLREVEESAKRDLLDVFAIDDPKGSESNTSGDINFDSLVESISKGSRSEVELQKAGAEMVVDAMKSITRQIAYNAGAKHNEIVDALLKANRFGFGWNAVTNKFGDMIKMGVIDPAKVVISAIEHSASVAGLLLTTEGMMVEEQKNDKRCSPRNKGNQNDYIPDDDETVCGDSGDDTTDE